jgi:hypothetical protein
MVWGVQGLPQVIQNSGDAQTATLRVLVVFRAKTGSEASPVTSTHHTWNYVW